MRWWKVKIWTDLTIETVTIFGQRKRYDCYFTYKTKFIYAKTKDDAEKKYHELFFNPIEDEYDKQRLSAMKFIYDTKSNNMIWDLPFNKKIVSSSEHICVVEQPIKEAIDVVRHMSTANDFRDWLMNGTCEANSIDDSDWIDK